MAKTTLDNKSNKKQGSADDHKQQFQHVLRMHNEIEERNMKIYYLM